MEILITLVAIQIILLLLKGTFLGKIFFMVMKIVKVTLKFDFMLLSKLFKCINKMVKNRKVYNKRKAIVNKQAEKKVVNGNNYDNVIDFKKLKKNHRK